MNLAYLLVAIPLSLIACKKGGGKPWSQVRTETSAEMTKLRERLLGVKAAIDKQPDPKAYAACTPNPAWVYAPGAPAQHTIDFIEYTRLALGGAVDSERISTRTFDSLPETSLSHALYWTHPKIEPSPATSFRIGYQAGFTTASATPAMELAVKAAAGIKTVVVVKDRAGSERHHVDVDAYVVTLDPPAVVCVMNANADGKVEGTAAKTVVYETYERKTGKTISTREVTEGGFTTGDATYDARNELMTLAWKRLGVTPAQCTSKPDCNSYDLTDCIDGACRLDPKQVAAAQIAAKKLDDQYATMLPTLESLASVEDECDAALEVAKTTKDFGSNTPFSLCLTRKWDVIKAAAAKANIPEAALGKIGDRWDAARKAKKTAAAGSGS